MSTKQLQHVLNIRGISYVQVHEKTDLVLLVDETGAVQQSELSNSVEDGAKLRTMTFTSYKQLLDIVDDWRDMIWFVHVMPKEKHRQTLIRCSKDAWGKVEKRLSTFHIQTGSFDCSFDDYSQFCRTLKNERFLLFVPSWDRRTSPMYSYEIFSTKHFDYQYILKWVTKALYQHVQKDSFQQPIKRKNPSIIEFHIHRDRTSSILPIYYFPLFYRYGTTVQFRIVLEENTSFGIDFYFRNSSRDHYIFNQFNEDRRLQESYSFQSLNSFLMLITINTHSLIYVYFIVLNIYLLHDIYFIQSFSWIKKLFIINLISTLCCTVFLFSFSTQRLDYILQTIAFYLVKYSDQSTFCIWLRNDFLIYSTTSKWILYPIMILLHITLGLCFRRCCREHFSGTNLQSSPEITLIDRVHLLCSNIWQKFLCLLFSDRRPSEHTDNTLLRYFAQDSLWLDPNSLLGHHSSMQNLSYAHFDFGRLPIWRFTTRRRQTSHGTCEYYSDIELEQWIHVDDPLNATKKSSLRRRPTNLFSITSQQENSYTSEPDENNNSVKDSNEELNSSERYQCSICLEKYLKHVYICTLPCLHHFHRRCLFNWLSNSEHQNCPLCRSPVLS